MPKRKPTMPEMPRVGIYCRVSSEEQVKEHYSLDTQQVRCFEKLNAVFGENLYVARVYVDEGFPGRYGLYDPNNLRKKHRPQLTRMWEAFQRGELDMICVYRMNRLWRKAASGDFLMDYFVPHGLKRVISCTENIDINTASGRFQLNIAAAVGAYEAEQLGEWVSDALQKRKQDGYTIGIPYGWRAEIDSEMQAKRRGIVPVPEEAEVVRQMAERYCAGESIRAIAGWLSLSVVPTPRKAVRWHTSAVKRILENPTHAGLVRALTPEGEEKLIQGAHYDRRIYDPDQYHQIIGLVASRRQTGSGRSSSPEYLISGLLRCGHCGRRLNGRMVERLKTRLYRCSTGSSESIPECVRNTERADAIENLIVSELRNLATDQSLLERAEAGMKKQLLEQNDLAAGEAQSLRKRLKQLWETYQFWSDQKAAGTCKEDEFEFHVTRFREDKAAVETLLKETESRQTQAASREALLKRARELLSDFEGLWQGLSMGERRNALLTAVEEATMARLDDGRTELRFRLRGFPEIVRHVARRSVVDRPETGIESLTPREQVAMYWYAQTPDRAFVAKKMGVEWQCANGNLWKARTKLGCATPEEAWETARDFVMANLEGLPLKDRAKRRKGTAKEGPLLTEAQRRVLALVRRKLTTDQIVAELGSKPNTVYVQLRDARLRLGVATTGQAVDRAVSLGLIETASP